MAINELRSVSTFIKAAELGSLRKAALDLRLVDATALADPEGKVVKCAHEVQEIWQRTAGSKCAQLVFCDLSVPTGGRGFSVYEDMRDKLIARGVPAADIEFIQNHDSDAAKLQLFRSLDDANPDPKLAALEDCILRTSNTLGIGTMGFGGGTTLLGCKAGAIHRIPASYFVSVAYDCWAFRRLGVILDAGTGAIRRWLYREDPPPPPMAAGGGFSPTGTEIPLRTPVGEGEIRRLKVGDIVLITGMIYTGRDAVHHHLLRHDSPVDLRGQVLYHCGPVILKEEGGWRIAAAGPTTSIREEPYEADVIARTGLGGVIGKGGRGARTLKALQDHAAVYLSAIGGAAQYYARCIEKVEGVDLLDLGVPEAMWHFRVRDFPAIVTMDASGNSLHAGVESASAAILRNLAAPVFT